MMQGSNDKFLLQVARATRFSGTVIIVASISGVIISLFVLMTVYIWRGGLCRHSSPLACPE